MYEAERDFAEFTPAIRSLIGETIALMRQYEIGYPTLDRITEDRTGFVDLARYVLDNVVRHGQADATQDEAGYLESLVRPAEFKAPSPQECHARALTFWAFVRSVQDLMLTSGQHALNEVARNTGFFGHLATTLRAFRQLEAWDGDGGEMIYWSDLASNRLETSLGADFALVVGLGNDLYKVAFLQAKRVRHFPFADVGYRVGKNRQVDLLVRHERRHPVRDPHGGWMLDFGDYGIVGRWCFYVFWQEVTDDGILLLPTVRSAHAVAGTMQGVYSSSLDHGVEFSVFAGLLLADADSRVGQLVDSGGLPPLFAGHEPHAVVFIDPPSNGPAPKKKDELLAALGYKPTRLRTRDVPAVSPDDVGTPGMGGI